MGNCGGGPQPDTPGRSAAAQGSAGSCHPCPLLGLQPGPCHVQPKRLRSCAAVLGGDNRGQGVSREPAQSFCARLPFKSRVLKYARRGARRDFGAARDQSSVFLAAARLRPCSVWVAQPCPQQPRATNAGVCPLGGTGCHAGTAAWVLGGLVMRGHAPPALPAGAGHWPCTVIVAVAVAVAVPAPRVPTAHA